MTQRLHTRSQPLSPYPGVRNPYNNQPFRDPQSIPETTPADFEPMMGQSNSLMSFLSPNETPVTPIAPSTGKSSFSMNDIKGFIDRMGGIDGIVSTLSKVQKVMQSVSQMAPMVKLMADTLLPRKKKKKGDDDDDFPTKRRRRRKRRTNPKSSPKGKARKRPSAPYKK